jgi:hypothetical protein
LYAIVNPVISALLRSPLHTLLSRLMFTITFTGRKSGRPFTIPVVYSRQGKTLFVLANGPWWRNFPGGTPITVWPEGSQRCGHATATDEPAELLPFLQRRLAKIGGITYALALNDLGPTQEPTDNELLHAARGSALVKIELC